MHGDSLLMLTTKVVSNKKPPLLSDSESGGSTSQNSNKDLLGKVASSYIKKNAICYLDTSTTVQYMCKYIKEKSTIYSNSIDIIEQLKDNATLDLHLLGGKLNPVN